jgi:hypothetical protein
VRATPQTVDGAEVYALLARVLAKLDEPTKIRADGIYLANWPSVRISVERAMIFKSDAETEAWTAWVDLIWMYNTNLPFTAARTHFIGLGGQPANALNDAVENWGKCSAPALISHIYGYLKAGAETWPAGHAHTVAGWACINGPYLLRGDTTLASALSEFLQQHPLVDLVRERLGTILKKEIPLHTVTLYRACAASEVYADVLIDNQPDELAGELLKQACWPAQLETSDFLSVRHFLLCVMPSSEQTSTQHLAPAVHRANKPLAALFVALLSAGLTFFLHEVFVAYASSVVPGASEGEYLLVPPSSFWYVPASVLGFLLSSFVIAVVVVQESTDDVSPLWRDHRPLLLGGVAIAALTGVLVYFAAHSYVKLTEERLEMRRLWSLGTESHPYSHINALLEAGAQGTGGTTFSIVLRDAEVWTTRVEVIFPNEREKRFLSARTGLQITTSNAQ